MKKGGKKNENYQRNQLRSKIPKMNIQYLRITFLYTRKYPGKERQSEEFFHEIITILQHIDLKAMIIKKLKLKKNII